MNQCKACTNKAKPDGYCGKHTRIGIIAAAEATGKILCNPLRGCFSEVTEGRKRCDPCRVKQLEQEKGRHAKHKEAADTIVLTEAETLCTLCLKPFETWATEHGTAKRCRLCYEKQKTLDLTRAPRQRNYAEEAARNMRRAFEGTREGCLSGKRGRIIEWCLTYEEFEALVTSPCKYCGQANETEIRGLDRVDNEKGYLKENVVAACGICNRMKHVFHPEFFVDHCRVIQTGFTTAHSSKWPEYYKHITHGFEYYKRMATTRRGLTWDLTKEDYVAMTSSACYICGYASGPIGIDRVDPSIGYLSTNCQSCCSPCNMMKHTLSVEDFHAKTVKIAIVDPVPFAHIPRKTYLLGR